jgi:DNA-binding transcriptional MerR regulator
MRIGELAEITQTQAETIRFYEREGLLREPPRTGSNYRVYGQEHLERLAFIRLCRLLDMTLDEIRLLLQFREAPRELPLHGRGTGSAHRAGGHADS